MTAKEKDRIDKLEERVESMQEDITKLKSYLYSDDNTNQPGVVESLVILQDKLDELIKREAVYKGKATVWGIVGGAVLSGLVWFVKFLIPKVI